MAADLILVPYLVGQEATGTGAGPLVLRDPAVAVLRPRTVIRPALRAAATAVGACFDLNRSVAEAVARARAAGALPVVLTGNCHTQQAVVAGLGVEDLGLVWLDAHADFHTMETTTSGFLDGLALAMVVGDCCTALCASVPGFAPLDAAQVVLVGARDVDPGERARLDAAALTELDAAAVDRLPAVLPSARRTSLHLDLDVLDPVHGRANPWAAPGGLHPDQLLDVVRAVKAERELAALTLSAYDPTVDPEGRVRDVAIAVLEAVA
jgi:arginase